MKWFSMKEANKKTLDKVFEKDKIKAVLLRDGSKKITPTSRGQKEESGLPRFQLLTFFI